MKSLVVMTPKTAQRLPVQESCSLILHGEKIHFGLIERPALQFDRDDESNAEAVLVKVEAFSCNFREKARFLDIARRHDETGFLVLGSEFSGTVMQVGAKVHDLQIGDRVCGNGSVSQDASHKGLTTQRSSTELQIIDRSKLMRIPTRMSWAEAAAFSVGAQTAYAMVRRLKLETGAHVLVTAAASNTALFAVQALQARGVQVHALTTSAHMQSHLAEIGITQCCLLDKRATVLDTVQSYLRQQGLSHFDAVLDPFMDIYLRKLLPCVKQFGQYISCGVYAQFHEEQADPFVHQGLTLDAMFNTLLRMSIELIGNNLGLTHDLETAMHDYQNGRLNIMLDSIARQGELHYFLERAYLAPNRRGKAVFQYQPELA